ncbi:MAG: hypothetical protein KC910_34305, partial [Candidatus Eremiobacteraeota bacterium]|nr:hypothetical protein [Candidatus Eremiobacteraeota bacterium]
MQLDLADCPACEQLGLPPDGRLYFFETPTFKAPRPVWSRAYSPGQMSPAVVHSTAQPEVRQKPEGVPWAAETSLTVSHFGRQKWPEDPAVGLTVEPALCLRPDASDPTALAALQKVLDKQNRALARRSAGWILIPGSFWEHERRDAYLTASGRANLTRLGRTKSMLPYRQILSGHELTTWEAQLEKLLEQQRAHPVAPPVAIDTAMQNSEPFLARAERDAQVLLAATAATAGAASFREQLETSLAQLKKRAGEGLSLADWASLASAIYSYSLQDLPKPEKAALAPLADQPRFCYYTTLLQRCTLFSRRDGAGSMFAVEQRARAEEGQPGIRRHGLPSEFHGVRDLQDRLWQLVQQEPLPLEQFGQARPQIEGWLRDLESRVEDIPWGNLHHMLNFAARAIAENNAAAQENFQSVDPEQTSELLTSLRWWRQRLEHHQSEQTRWQPLLS